MRVVFILVVCSTVFSLQARSNLSESYSISVLDSILVDLSEFNPIPKAGNSYWTTAIPPSAREDYIKLGEKFANKTWIGIPDSLFAEYKTIGNRSRYEKQCFEKRTRLASLAMAEIMEHKGRFLGDIINGLRYFKSEVWWGNPSSYPKSHPVDSIQIVELFGAETASLIAWTVYMLGQDLEKVDKNICSQMKQEIERRLLSQARNNDYWWKKSSINWNPWICSNWLTCVLLCETDRNTRIQDVHKILKCLEFFYDGYASDGGCDEGIIYWSKAAASFYDCLRLLGEATNYRISMENDPKLKAMGQYPQNMLISDDIFVDFADSTPKMTIFPQIGIPFGMYTKDSSLMGYSMRVAEKTDYFSHPANLFLYSGNFPVIGRELFFLARYEMYRQAIPKESLQRDVFLPNLQVCTARSKSDSKQGFFVASKGGHNDESHNHNDVGNFIVYKNGEPVLIDIGVGVYTAKTFSKDRYELFNCRSAFHNVPLINGKEQCQGKKYQARNVRYKQTDRYSEFALDIAGAYPEEAHVMVWDRTIRLNRGKNVIITEDYQLKNNIQPSQIVLVCYGDPTYLGNGMIQIKDGERLSYLKFSARQLSPEIEVVKHNDSFIFNAWKKRNLYRIKLNILNQSLKGTIKYELF